MENHPSNQKKTLSWHREGLHLPRLIHRRIALPIPLPIPLKKRKIYWRDNRVSRESKRSNRVVTWNVLCVNRLLLSMNSLRIVWYVRRSHRYHKMCDWKLNTIVTTIQNGTIIAIETICIGPLLPSPWCFAINGNLTSSPSWHSLITSWRETIRKWNHNCVMENSTISTYYHFEHHRLQGVSQAKMKHLYGKLVYGCFL